MNRGPPASSAVPDSERSGGPSEASDAGGGADDHLGLRRVNRRDRLPPELLSRFVEFQFAPNSEQEFIRVAEEVISRQLGKDRALAQYLAEQVAKRTRGTYASDLGGQAL